MRRSNISLIAAIVLAFAAKGAVAQAADTELHPATFKLGVFLPSNGDLKNGVGNTWLSIGAEYAFLKHNQTSKVTPLAYLDNQEKSKDASATSGSVTATGTFQVNTVGIGGGVRAYGGANANASVRPYVGAGVGVYFTTAKLSINLTDGVASAGESSSEHKTNVGYKINAGVEFKNRFLLEVAYVNPGKFNSVDLSGVNVLAGMRF